MIELEKGRRGHKERDAVAAHKLADGGRVERGGMEHHPRVVVHDEPEDEITEGVEKRQHPKYALLLVEMEDLAGTLRIGVDAEMGEHHAFGLSGAAAAENDGGQVFHRQRGLLPTGPFDHPRRGAEGQETCDEFLAWADRAGDIFQPDNRGAIRQIQFGLLDEGSTGDDGAKVCDSHGCFKA